MLEIKRNAFVRASQIIDDFLQRNVLRARHAIFYQLQAVVQMQLAEHDFTAALKAINQALMLNQRSEKALKIKLVILEQQKQAGQPVDRRELLRAYRNLCAITDDLPFKKAVVDKLFKMGEFHLAYEELASLNEHNAETTFDLALLALRSKRFSAALQHIEEACKLKPMSLKNRLLHVEILLQHDATKGLTLAQGLMQEERFRPLARAALLQLLPKISDKQPVLEALLVDKQQHPVDVEALACLADVSLLLGFSHQALALYQQLANMLQIASARPEFCRRLNYNICLTALLTGQMELCQSSLISLLPSAQAWPEVYHLQAALWQRQGFPQQALAIMQLAARLRPLDAVLLEGLQDATWQAGLWGQSLYVGMLLKVTDPLDRRLRGNFVHRFVLINGHGAAKNVQGQT
jgi:tetratricopeptide (TPR) repeat protein